MIVSGKHLGLALCEALKLDPKSKITKITIVSAVDDAARVQVERLITEDETEAIAAIMSEYELVDKTSELTDAGTASTS